MSAWLIIRRIEIMIKKFCDGCGKEITNHYRSDTPEIQYPLKISVKGTAAFIRLEWMEEVKEPKHFCLNCVIDAVSGLDTRPKAA
jgi:hypothetical protein